MRSTSKQNSRHETRKRVKTSQTFVDFKKLPFRGIAVPPEMSSADENEIDNLGEYSGKKPRT
jgi:hypothetical protein